MPIPTPHTDEARDEFVNRCMGDSVMKQDYTDVKQRVAVCYAAWRKAHPHAEPKPTS